MKKKISLKTLLITVGSALALLIGTIVYLLWRQRNFVEILKKAEEKVEKRFPPLAELDHREDAAAIKTQFIREVQVEAAQIGQDSKETIIAKFDKAFGVRRE